MSLVLFLSRSVQKKAARRENESNSASERG
jgi:hypothetical protein